MRKLMIMFFMSAINMFLLTGCSKQGPQGAEGPQGSPGLQGPQGTTGTANVIYSNWIDGKSLKWADTIFAYVPYSRMNILTNALTQGIIDQGLVLVYVKAGDYNFPLPVQLNLGGKTFQSILINLGIGRITVLSTYFTGISFSASEASGTSYRYIIVPGGLLGGRLSKGSVTYDFATLKNLTYRQVVNFLGIPESSSNLDTKK